MMMSWLSCKETLMAREMWKTFDGQAPWPQSPASWGKLLGAQAVLKVGAVSRGLSLSWEIFYGVTGGFSLLLKTKDGVLWGWGQDPARVCWALKHRVFFILHTGVCAGHRPLKCHPATEQTQQPSLPVSPSVVSASRRGRQPEAVHTSLHWAPDSLPTELGVLS